MHYIILQYFVPGVYTELIMSACITYILHVRNMSHSGSIRYSVNR